jgi:hypothetical protein
MSKFSQYPEVTSANDDDLLLLDVEPITSNSTSVIQKSNLLSGTVKTTGDQTISGVKTFTGEVIVPTPSNSTDATTKTYVDNAVASAPGNVPATFTSNGTVKQTVYNVRDYGAVGDGVTDDATAINAAITAAGSGGIIFLSDGIYAIGNPLLLRANQIFRGSGTGSTIIRLIPSALANFGSTYMLKGATVTDTDCVIQDLSMDGNYSNLVAPAANQGGLIGVRSGFIVERVEFMSSNYFKLFINAVSDVTARDCFWTGTVGAGEDNIGGGGGSSNILIENCRWVSGVNGNATDLTGATNVKYLNNKNYSSSSAFFEAVSDSVISGNIFIGGGDIVLQSDSGYSPTNVTNSRNNRVEYNIVKNSIDSGIKIAYNQGGATIKGGFNQISNNYIEASKYSGIAIIHHNTITSSDCAYGFDSILNNTCVNNNQANVSSVNFGFGIAAPSGINLTRGLDSVISGNTCTDNQDTPTQNWGIQIGQTNSPSAITEPDYVICAYNDCNGNKLGTVNVVSPTFTTHYTSNDTLSVAYVVKTSTYSIISTDSVVECTSGTFTVTLPTAIGVTGKQYSIKNSGTGVITVATTSAQTIDGGSTATLQVRYVSITVVSDGANWKVI